MKKKITILVLFALILNAFTITNASAADPTVYINGYKMNLVYNNPFEAKLSTNIVNNRQITAVWVKITNYMTITVSQYQTVNKKTVLQGTKKYTLSINNLDKTGVRGILKDLSNNKTTNVNEIFGYAKVQSADALRWVIIGLTAAEIAAVAQGFILITGAVVLTAMVANELSYAIEQAKAKGESTTTNPKGNKIYYFAVINQQTQFLEIEWTIPRTINDVKLFMKYNAKLNAYTANFADALKLCSEISPIGFSTFTENHYYLRKPPIMAPYFDHFHPRVSKDNYNHTKNHCFYGNGR